MNHIKTFKQYNGFDTENESILDIFQKNTKIAYNWLVKENGLGRSYGWLTKWKTNKIAKDFVTKYFQNKTATNNWTDLGKMDRYFADYIVNEWREKIEGSITISAGDPSAHNQAGSNQTKITTVEAEPLLKKMFNIPETTTTH